MLPKNARLSRQEFSTVFARPQKRTHFPECSIYYTPSPTFKASVVVGKKVAKLAVVRNRLRREVYGALQTQLFGDVDLQGNYIFIFKPSFAKLSKAKRQAVVSDLLAQNLKSR
ncbi:MAG: ribonuclease P protein component [Candidatus Paceibacteria bacterium]